jgi:hypothetical protein
MMLFDGDPTLLRNAPGFHYKVVIHLSFTIQHLAQLACRTAKHKTGLFGVTIKSVIAKRAQNIAGTILAGTRVIDKITF